MIRAQQDQVAQGESTPAKDTGCGDSKLAAVPS